MNPDNTKPLGDRRTPARQKARNEHAVARRMNKASRHREPLLDIQRLQEWSGGETERRPIGPNDARLRAFEGRDARPRSGRQRHDASYRK